MTNWTKEKIKEETLKSIDILCIDRMPTREEFVSINRNDLHCAISKIFKYSVIAKDMGLELKRCETRKGQKYEKIAEDLISKKGYDVQRMSTKHPYDLLVNECIKIDIKVSKPHFFNSSRTHSFRTAKKFATCDIYIMFAMDENENLEKLLIIPGYKLKITTLCIGKNSSYDKYIERWDYLNSFDLFYKKIIQ